MIVVSLGFFWRVGKKRQESLLAGCDINWSSLRKLKIFSS